MRSLFQVLVLAVLAWLAYDFIAAKKPQSWSYCGEDVKQEKQKMEKQVRVAMRDLGDDAEVTWKESANCVSASVAGSRGVAAYLVNQLKARF